MSGSALKPAAELARGNSVRFPNESAEYRRVREQLLAEEIELRRHIERVAELRRALPPGGAVTKNYEFEGEGGKATLSDLFGDKQTLAIYSYMFGPAREQPCPMGTWTLDVSDAKPKQSKKAHGKRVAYTESAKGESSKSHQRTISEESVDPLQWGQEQYEAETMASQIAGLSFEEASSSRQGGDGQDEPRIIPVAARVTKKGNVCITISATGEELETPRDKWVTTQEGYKFNSRLRDCIFLAKTIKPRKNK